MNKIMLPVIVALMIGCMAAPGTAGNVLFFGTVYYNGNPIQGAVIYSEHVCETTGWSGIETAGSPDTSAADGSFDAHGYYPNDWNGYYNICITYGNTWKHLFNVYANMPYGTNLGTINLQTGTHSHPACQ